MARQCEICGKGPRAGNSISFSHIRSKRRFLPNLQRVRAIVDGHPRQVLVCTTCLKSGRVRRAPRTGAAAGA